MTLAVTATEWIQIASIVAVGVVNLWTNRKVERVHKATNSVLDKLIASTKQASFAEGVKSAEDAQKSKDT